MSYAKVWCLLGLLSLGSVAASQAQQTGGGTEKAVMALEDQWLKSQKTNNSDLVAPLLADNFVSTGDDGKVTDKAQSLANAKASKYVSAENENVKVTVFGDTAIATGLWVGNGTDEKGKSFDVRDRWTDTWVKMPNGKWQCVATQSTQVKK
jgi:ketosteroid isomerase-like protein